MRILFTNHSLRSKGGTETVVIDFCRLLRARGHEVMVFSSRLGHTAELLRAELFTVVDDLKNLPLLPDIIHGHHHLETMSALFGLPETPAIFYSHGAIPWQECLPIHPRILRYINLSEGSRKRVMIEKALPAEKCVVLPNHVILKRFTPPKTPPQKLRTAALCSRSSVSPEILKTIRNICGKAGLEFKHETDWTLGKIDDPKEIYSRYDLIFGTGRTALEALTYGCAVSTTDSEMLGSLITPENMVARREINYSRTLWEEGISAESLASQINNYSAADQQKVLEYIRVEADSEKSTDQLLDVYETVLTEWNNLPRPVLLEDMSAGSNYLRALGSYLDETRKKEKKLQQVLFQQEALLTESENLIQIWQRFARRTWLHVFFTRNERGEMEKIRRKIAKTIVKK